MSARQAFTRLREDNRKISNPAIASTCRLDKSNIPLLRVTLKTEASARDILVADRMLPQSSNDYTKTDVCIIADLVHGERQAAFEHLQISKSSKITKTVGYTDETILVLVHIHNHVHHVESTFTWSTVTLPNQRVEPYQQVVAMLLYLQIHRVIT